MFFVLFLKHVLIYTVCTVRICFCTFAWSESFLPIMQCSMHYILHCEPRKRTELIFSCLITCWSGFTSFAFVNCGFLEHVECVNWTCTEHVGAWHLSQIVLVRLRVCYRCLQRLLNFRLRTSTETQNKLRYWSHVKSHLRWVCVRVCVKKCITCSVCISFDYNMEKILLELREWIRKCDHYLWMCVCVYVNVYNCIFACVCANLMCLKFAFQ